MSKKKEIGKTIEGKSITEVGWKNYAHIEGSGETVDNLHSLESMKNEKENSSHIKRTDIAKLLDINKDTLYKLDAKIKKDNCQKSLKKLDDYIDLYLLRKYLKF